MVLRDNCCGRVTNRVRRGRVYVVDRAHRMLFQRALAFREGSVNLQPGDQRPRPSVVAIVLGEAQR